MILLVEVVVSVVEDVSISTMADDPDGDIHRLSKKYLIAR